MILSFEEWRKLARSHLEAERSPGEIDWTTGRPRRLLFESAAVEPSQPQASVPAAFLTLAKRVICHSSVDRYALLYRLLWRLTHNEPYLLEIDTDADVHQAAQLSKAVKRDAHKMKAFVRFRKIDSPQGERFVAWHRPDHRIVRLVGPFFARRFPEMTWSILTPEESVHWDQSQLSFGDGVPADQAPAGDVLEDLWKAYYRSTFNPARLNVSLMKQEMPVRHWATLPEAELIPELLADAGERVKVMVEAQEGNANSAADFMPARVSLKSLREHAAHCTACPLYEPATQTVFGEGPAKPRLVLVGEQPGDEEDRTGKPFVGPAGRVLESAFAAAGIDRKQVYVTNTVKHFKFVDRGKRRLHKKPNAREIAACRPWLEAELAYLKPAGLILLGATAAQTVLGRDFRITKDRGVPRRSEWCENTIATWHPAAILRAPDERRREEMTAQLIADLAQAAG